MQDADVQEHGGEHTPPLAIGGLGPVVGAPLDKMINCWCHGMHATSQQQTKDSHVEAEQHRRDSNFRHESSPSTLRPYPATFRLWPQSVAPDDLNGRQSRHADVPRLAAASVA